MKNPMRLFTLGGVLLLTIVFARVDAAPEQEKAFTDKYKTAMEGKDTATLESFLYTQGSDLAALEFYKMMQSGEAGEKISSIELVNLTPEDVKKSDDAHGRTNRQSLPESQTNEKGHYQSRKKGRQR